MRTYDILDVLYLVLNGGPPRDIINQRMFSFLGRMLLPIGFGVIVAGCGQQPEPSSGVALALTPELVDSAKPAITSTEISADIVGRVVNVTGLWEIGPPTPWTFEPDDVREVIIVDEHMAGRESTVYVFVATDNTPRPREVNVHVAGTLRLHYEWSDG